jgi:hypothetical protein
VLNRLPLVRSTTIGLLAGVLASSLSLAAAGSVHRAHAKAVDKSDSAAATAANASASWHARDSERYKVNWGVDVGGVHRVSSGYMLRFTYRVLDAEKAQPLFDKRAKPYLIDDSSGARLMVPAMENIGELRQSPAPMEDRNYFMIFGNPGKLVKPGSHVTVVIGNLHIDGLVVE